jgi:dihydroorotate dehydrogenase electron transfer subunit
LLLAGGVGLPPLHVWWQRHARPQDAAFFGGRDGADVPWSLLAAGWQVSVDRRDGLPPGQEAYCGTVIEAFRECEADLGSEPWLVLTCGPLPMLRAAVALAADRGWRCLVSVEERMGCGYGVCRGCVIPARGGGHLTACQDGPVLSAAEIDWDQFGHREG